MLDSIRIFFKNIQNLKGFYKFIIILGIFIFYFIYVASLFGIRDGLSITLLTWAFFVFFTPITDSDILFNFPMKVITNIDMQYTELFVIILGSLIIGSYYIIDVNIFNKTTHTTLIKKIIEHPEFISISIIGLSLFGSLLAAYLENNIYVAFMENNWNLLLNKEWYLAYGIICAAYLYLVSIKINS